MHFHINIFFSKEHSARLVQPAELRSHVQLVLVRINRAVVGSPPPPQPPLGRILHFYQQKFGKLSHAS
jgi:hypothetical protein